MDTMCIYLRLFLGMGIIWYFEILAFALTSYDSGTALTFQWTSVIDASPSMFREDNKYVTLEYRTKPQKEVT